MTTDLIVLGSYAVAFVMDVERLPVSGETLRAANFRQTWGGKGSDMAVQAARLGARVTYLGVIGSDIYGEDCIRLLENEGIDLIGLRSSSDLPTGAGFIVKDRSGNNFITVDMGANSEFSPEDIDRHSSVFRDQSVVLSQLEIPLRTALHGLTLARNAGAQTVLNPAPACRLDAVDLSCVDVLTPNATEARVILGVAPDAQVDNGDLCRQLLDIGCGAVVMTCGGEGSMVATGDRVFHCPPFSVEVADTNGAGDAFSAAVAVALGEGMDLEEAVHFASAVAALSCTGWETIDSYKDRQTVQEFLRTAGASKGTVVR